MKTLLLVQFALITILAKESSSCFYSDFIFETSDGLIFNYYGQNATKIDGDLVSATKSTVYVYKDGCLMGNSLGTHKTSVSFCVEAKEVCLMSKETAAIILPDNSVQICSLNGGCKTVATASQSHRQSLGWSPSTTELFFVERSKVFVWSPGKEVSLFGLLDEAMHLFVKDNYVFIQTANFVVQIELLSNQRKLFELANIKSIAFNGCVLAHMHHQSNEVLMLDISHGTTMTRHLSKAISKIIVLEELGQKSNCGCDICVSNFCLEKDGSSLVTIVLASIGGLVVVVVSVCIVLASIGGLVVVVVSVCIVIFLKRKQSNVQQQNPDGIEMQVVERIQTVSNDVAETQL